MEMQEKYCKQKSNEIEVEVVEVVEIVEEVVEEVTWYIDTLPDPVLV
jgi:hypothetical protein